jgi:hypothetical protein
MVRRESESSGINTNFRTSYQDPDDRTDDEAQDAITRTNRYDTIARASTQAAVDAY